PPLDVRLAPALAGSRWLWRFGPPGHSRRGSGRRVCPLSHTVVPGEVRLAREFVIGPRPRAGSCRGTSPPARGAGRGTGGGRHPRRGSRGRGGARRGSRSSGGSRGLAQFLPQVGTP